MLSGGSIIEIDQIVQTLVGYPLAVVFLILYIRAQGQLVTVQKEAAAMIAAGQEKAAASIAAAYKEIADQRKEENGAMRALLFDLARRGIRPLDETQPLVKAEVAAAIAEQRARATIANTPN